MVVKNQTDFQKVIVIGYGRIAYEVLQHVFALRESFGYEVQYIEYEVYPFNRAVRFAQEHDIFFRNIPEKSDLTDFLLSQDKKTLIISAHNTFLFPKSVVEKLNVTIINFHNALLPHYPGRNAPSWMIYENASEAGITWHYVTAEVDAGNIIIQKRCDIEREIKAYQLADQLMVLGYEGFEECIETVLKETVRAVSQEIRADRRIYKSTDVPGDAHFTDMDAPADIYRLLRAVDYGKNRIFPQVMATLKGREVRIERYRKVEAEDVPNGEDRMFLPLDDGYLMLKYSLLNI
ncbi:formyltransferase family protein [Oscillospiraceae bacterium 38-13]